MRRTVTCPETGRCSRCGEQTAIVRWFENDDEARGLCPYCLALVIKAAMSDPFFAEQLEEAT